MQFAEDRSLRLSNGPGQRDYWEERYNNLEHNPTIENNFYQTFVVKVENLPDKDYTNPLSPLRKQDFGKLTPAEERLADRDALANAVFTGDKTIARAQASLVIAGYQLEDNRKFGVTGQLDPATTQALTDFQKAAGLNPTGKLDQETMKTLDSIAVKGLTKSEIETLGRQAARECDPLRQKPQEVRLFEELSPQEQQRITRRNELVQTNWAGRGDIYTARAQASLQLAGYDIGKFGIDGKDGPDTSKATLQFQKDRGLNPTGILEIETMIALNNATAEGWKRPLVEQRVQPKQTINKEQLPKYSVSYDSSKTLGRHPKIEPNQKGIPFDQIKIAQNRLQEIGFDIGRSGVDGKIGKDTRGAITAFQQTFGLPVTGELDQRTAARIESEYGKGAVVKTVENQDLKITNSENNKNTKIDNNIKKEWVKINGITILKDKHTLPVIIRSDVAESFSDAVNEINSLGGKVATAGGKRDLSVYGGSSRSSTSLHYTGLAVDLATNCGMQNPNTDLYIIVRVGGTDTQPKWNIYCRTKDETVKESTLNAAIWQKGIGISEQQVTGKFIDVTAVMKKHGWEPISARTNWKGVYDSCEWWHFQKVDNTIPKNATFESELLKIYDQNEITRYFTSERAKYLNYVWRKGIFIKNKQREDAYGKN